MRLALAALLLVSLTACGGGDDKPAAKPESSSTPTPSEATPTPTPTADPGADLAASLAAIREHSPKGYPRLVALSSVPEQMRGQFDSKTQVVAAAPGVWADLTPGATIVDAMGGEVFVGYCASVKAWERQYWDGYEFGGSCY